MKKKILAMVLSLTMLWGLTVNAAESVEEVSQNDGTETIAESDTEVQSETSVEQGMQDGSEIVASGMCGESVTWGLSSDGVLTISGNGEMVIETDVENQVINQPWKDLAFNQVVIEEGVTNIDGYAFAYLPKLEKITMAGSVTSIGEYAFYQTEEIGKIEFSDNISEIDEWAFAYCGLEEVELPKNLKNIGEEAFRLNHITELTIPDGVISIGEMAFAHCYDLEKVYIPSSVTSIGEDAFAFCNDIITLYGNTGSYAETYAEENEINFVALDKPGSSLVIVPEKTDETYVLGSGKDLVIYCTGDFSEFVSVEMDGVLVDPSNYKVEEGSTVLTFSSAYLDTLSPGRHVVTLNFVSGSISTYITLLNASEANTSNSNGVNGSVNGNNASQNSGKTSNTVRTGDNGNVALWFTLTVAALGCVVSVIIRRKRVA